MSDDSKELIELAAEIEQLRERIRELEEKAELIRRRTQTPECDIPCRAKRTDLRTPVEFIADFDIVEAQGINISESGICFAADEDLAFEMRFDYEGRIYEHRANLVWCRRLPEGGCLFGLKFAPPKENESF